jgi:hypothetical protein
MALEVSAAALVTQVAHPAVPDVVIVPPLKGDEKTICVTVPLPPPPPASSVHTFDAVQPYKLDPAVASVAK